MTGIDAGRFSSLFHIYGPATETPAHLSALVGDDDAAREAALRHLWSALIHQGTPTTATPVAAVIVAGILDDARLTGDANAGLRARLLDFLAEVAREGCRPESARAEFVELATTDRDFDAEVTALVEAGREDDFWEDEALPDVMFGRAVLGCREALPAVLAGVVPLLHDPDPEVRRRAIHAAKMCRRVLTLPDATADERAAADSAQAPRSSPRWDDLLSL